MLLALEILEGSGESSANLDVYQCSAVQKLFQSF